MLTKIDIKTICGNDEKIDVVWGSCDPRTGKIVLYSKEHCIAMEKSYQDENMIYHIPEYNAKVIFEKDNFFQSTPNGSRDVFREEIIEGQSDISRNVVYDPDKKGYYISSQPIQSSDQKTTHVVFVVDRSGSMQVENKYGIVTEQGVEEFVSKQREEENVRFYASTFNHSNEIHFNHVDLKTVDDLTLREKFYTIKPSGSTSYYDAVIEMITVVKSHYTDNDEVVICIMTDGIDNTSRYSRRDMVNMVKEVKSMGWMIVMIGTNDIDTENLGEDYGIGRGASIGMCNNVESAGAAFRALSSGVSRVRGGLAKSIHFTELERQSTQNLPDPPQSSSI